MSKRVKYAKTGYIGIASDKVAKILEEKGTAKILGDVKPVEDKPEEKADKK